MVGKRIWRLGWAAALLLLMAVLLAAAGRETPVPLARTECVSFTESAKELKNPNRGFYHMHGFVISDEEADYAKTVARQFRAEVDASLTLIEINLKEYRDRPISAKGLANLEELFQALAKTDKQLILRFLYDWEGRAKETEPDSLGQILSHMRQLGPLLKKYSGIIFTLQGVFVGECGEMHGSNFLSEEQVLTLVRQLEKVTEEGTYLAVRTPAHWRRTAKVSNPAKLSRKDRILALRLGLFNDGMLGSSSDCGTYGNGTLERDGPNVNWKREEELAFQDALCRLVPNGGEVTIDNPYNDLEPALEALGRMRVTYLNWEHDEEVLEKWAASKVSEKSCFDGMDGLSYVERHLGYRLVLREARLSSDENSGALSVAADIQNVGFAPVYKEAEAKAVLWNSATGQKLEYAFTQDVRSLAGGTDSGRRLTLWLSIPQEELKEGDWAVFLDLRDKASGKRIFFGNEQAPGRYGYRLGGADYTGGAER